MGAPFAFNTPVWPGTLKLAEEMNELGVELSKLMMVNGVPENYWGNRPLRQKIIEETADVIASSMYFVEKNITDDELDEIAKRVEAKLAAYRLWEVEE